MRKIICSNCGYNDEINKFNINKSHIPFCPRCTSKVYDRIIECILISKKYKKYIRRNGG